jgi:hypothetical protein
MRNAMHKLNKAHLLLVLPVGLKADWLQMASLGIAGLSQRFTMIFGYAI